MKKTAKPISLFGLSTETVLNYPKAQPMETPGLQKAQRVLELLQHDQFGKESSAMSISETPALDELFEKIAKAKLSEAQRRYPELQKVAIAAPVKTVSSARKVPATDKGSAHSAPAVQSSLSGGAA